MPTAIQLTEDQFYHSMRGLDRARAKQYLPAFNATLTEYNFDNLLELAHFLGQLAHESCDLKYWEEIWGPTRSQLKYEGRMDLGNTNPGDGYLYRGRGPIQTTGRSNYTRVATKLGIDCVTHPELLTTPQHGFRAAALFWRDNSCQAKALADDIPGLTKIINGGQNGLDDRRIKTAKAKAALGL